MSWVSPQTGYIVCRPLTLSGSGTCTIRAAARLDWRNFPTTSGFSGTELMLVWADMQEWFLALPKLPPSSLQLPGPGGSGRIFPMQQPAVRLKFSSAVHIEDCEGWWLSCCRGLVAEHWWLKPGVAWVRLLVTAGLFTFFYLHLITSKFIYVTSSYV